MRQKLASARQSSHLESSSWAIEAIAASATASRLGLLLSRGLDNADSSALQRAALLIARRLKHEHRLNHRYALRCAQQVLGALQRPLCELCAGRRYVGMDNGVQSICGDCGGCGRVSLNWGDRGRGVEHATRIALAALRQVGVVTRARLAQP